MCDLFKVKCPVSSAKKQVQFYWKQINLAKLYYKMYTCLVILNTWKFEYCFEFENNLPPKLNPNLNLSDSVNNSKHDLKSICCRSHAILASTNLWILLSWLMIYRILECYISQVQCCTRCAIKQVYYVKKATHMELLMWCTCENLLVYKSLQVKRILRS